MRKTIILIAVIAIVFSMGSVSHAQMNKNSLNLGLKLGYFWGIGLSLEGEYVFLAIPSIGGFVGAGGVVGFGGRSVTWPSYYGGGSYGYKYTYIPVLIFGSFHYPFKNIPRLVPYARLGFGLEFVSAKATGEYAGTWASSEGTGFQFFSQLGIRYGVLPMLWVVGAVGYPFYIMVGIDFTLNF